MNGPVSAEPMTLSGLLDMLGGVFAQHRGGVRFSAAETTAFAEALADMQKTALALETRARAADDMEAMARDLDRIAREGREASARPLRGAIRALARLAVEVPGSNVVILPTSIRPAFTDGREPPKPEETHDDR